MLDGLLSSSEKPLDLAMGYVTEITYYFSDPVEQKEAGHINVNDRIDLVAQGMTATLIADGVFEDDEYCPFKFTSMFWYWLLHSYTDFDLSVGIDSIVEALETTTLIEELKAAINPMQFANIESSAKKLIDARLNRSEFDKLCADARVLLAEYNVELRKFMKSKTFKQFMKNISKLNLGDLNLGGILAPQTEGTDVKQ